MLVEVSRSGRGGSIEVPIAELHSFRPTFHNPCQHSSRRSYMLPVLSARMWCSIIPDGAEFGHSCTHGPPPHRIRVVVNMRKILSLDDAKRLAREANALAAVYRQAARGGDHDA